MADAISFEDTEPVSYTHLDVYKRQVPIKLHKEVTGKLAVKVVES